MDVVIHEESEDARFEKIPLVYERGFIKAIKGGIAN